MIILLGDCWVVGAWGRQHKNKSILAGPGLAQYIQLNIDKESINNNHSMTINLSKSNCSNSFQLAALEKLLNRFTPNKSDRFIWVVTDPAKCITIKDLQTTDTLKSLIEQKLLKSLNDANNLANQFDFKFNLIGGLCDLNTIIEHKFYFLEYTVPSWPGLLGSNYSPSIYSNIGTFYLKNKVHKHRPDLIDEWTEINEVAKNKYLQFKKMQDFFVNNQPNEFAHRVLRDVLFPLQTHIL